MLTLVACVVVLKVTVGIVFVYQTYLPPDFRSAFLRGREWPKVARSIVGAL